MSIVATLPVVTGIYTAKLLDKEEYYDITVLEAKELIEETPDLVILDVRIVSEYEENHLENTINIPTDELQVRLDELNKKDKILVYCRTGNRSSTALEILIEAGYTEIYHMYEGIKCLDTKKLSNSSVGSYPTKPSEFLNGSPIYGASLHSIWSIPYCYSI